MKKILILAMLAIFLLGACAAEQQVKATEIPAKTVQATPDVSLATPNVGFATVREPEGLRMLMLYSQPGQVAPGEKGKVVGLNATETWVLLQFPEQSGWLPANVLELVLAR